MSRARNTLTKQAKKTTSDALIEELWRRQDAYTLAVDKRWQSYMGPAVQTLSKRRSGFPDAIRGLLRRSLRFGDLPGFVELSNKLIRDIYVVGALYIHERDRIVRERGKLPPNKDAFQINKAAGETLAIAEFNFSLVDQQAVDAIAFQHNMWFTTEGGAVYGGVKLDKITRTLIEDGVSAISIADRIQTAADKHFGVGTFANRGLTYWSGVAEHAASTAAISGQLVALQSLGWTRYVIMNPMDERTVPVCQQMNGKTLLVEHGIANMFNALDAKTPDEVRAVKPFVSGGSASQLEQAIGGKLGVGAKDLSAQQSADLSKAGFAMPPYHFRCRSVIDIAFDPGDTTPGPTIDDIIGPTEHKRIMGPLATPLTEFTKRTYPGASPAAKKVIPDGPFDEAKFIEALDALDPTTKSLSVQDMLRVRANPAESEVRKQLNNILAEYRLVDQDIIGSSVRTSKRHGFNPPLKKKDLIKIPKLSRHADAADKDAWNLLRSINARHAMRIKTPNRIYVTKRGHPRHGGAYHDWSGGIKVSEYDKRRTVEFLKGRTDDGESLSTFVHEALHGHSMMHPSAYHGIGRVIEESTVELMARSIMRKKFPRSLLEVEKANRTSLIRRWGAYEGTIADVADAVKSAADKVGLKFAKEEAYELTAQAGFKMRIGVKNAVRSGSGHADNFVTAIEFPEELPKLTAAKRRLFESHLTQELEKIPSPV